MISIIMPVYNIERKQTKLKAAIHSVLSQSLSDFELIVVNDGSSDKTEQILLELQKSDKRIQIISKENGGVESARREGLRNTKGDFILHMDQDDMYRNDALKVFLRTIEETGADVVVANNARFIFNKRFSFGKCNTPSMQSEKVINHDGFMNQYFVSFFGINDFPVNIWNKMYRKKFLDRCPEPPLTGQIIEDLSYNMHILPYAKIIAIIPDVLYYYRWGGFTNRYDKTILDTALTGYRLKTCQIEKYGKTDFKVYTAIELLNYINTYFLESIEYNILNKDEFIIEAKRIFAVPEVVKSVSIVRDYNRYHKDYIDAMLAYDFNRLYSCEIKTNNASWKKQMLKSFLLKF